jgi:membrane protein YdbS with pleckstrin-like domain
MADIFVAPKLKKKMWESVPSPEHIPVLKKSENMSAFSTFRQNPTGVRFQNQKQDESIVLFLRSHLIVNVLWVTMSVIAIIIPIIILAVLPSLKLEFLSSSVSIRFTIIFVLFYYLLVSSYVFINFLHWFYNVFIATTKRVVDIDYSDIIIHNIAITSITQVQDVNYTQSGFISTFFNYGNIFVQTAGTETNFEAYSVPKPTKATNIIGNLIGKTRSTLR